jgi:hypothetical protein
MNKKYGYVNWPENSESRFERALELFESGVQSIYNVLNWIWYDRQKVKKFIHIDHYDTWSMDHTLAPIILPMLKQLKNTKHGSPMVDFEDVPEHMRATDTEDYDSQLTFEFYNDKELCKQNVECDIHTRWSWVLDEMIWAFEQKCDDNWEDKYFGEWVPNDTEPFCGSFKNVDWEGRQAHQARMSNGFKLFGKYYEGLWD